MDVTNEITVVTSAALPRLRLDMQGYLELPFSGEFHEACRQAIAAIDAAVDDDETTHEPVKRALENWTLIGEREISLHTLEAGSC